MLDVRAAAAVADRGQPNFRGAPATMNGLQWCLLVAAFLAWPHVVAAQTPAAKPAISAEQEAEIRSLIEELVVEDSIDPTATGAAKEAAEKEYFARCKRCREAFAKLSEYKDVAFPFLVEHLNDDRPSIHFRNHVLEHSVKHACYFNIYFQLQDRPRGYSQYGWSRMGRDGEEHPQPYWVGTPFDEAGGLKKWLEQNKALSYPEMQIKCLTWLLNEEKAIGAPDAASYFRYILPLEVQILEHRKETGADVEQELNRLRTVLKNKRPADVPAGLLPTKPLPKEPSDSVESEDLVESSTPAVPAARPSTCCAVPRAAYEPVSGLRWLGERLRRRAIARGLRRCH